MIIEKKWRKKMREIMIEVITGTMCLIATIALIGLFWVIS